MKNLKKIPFIVVALCIVAYLFALNLVELVPGAPVRSEAYSNKFKVNENISVNEDRMKSFKIVYYKGGNMGRYDSIVTISLENAQIEQKFFLDKSYERKAAFEVSKDELATLYALFEEQKFNTIRSKQEAIHDRGGETITLYQGRTKVEVSNFGPNVITEGDKQRFDTLVLALDNFIADKINAVGSPITFLIPKSLYDDFYSISLDGGETASVLKENLVRNGLYYQFVTTLLPGSYTVGLSIKDKSDYYGYASDETVLEITPNAILTLTMNKDKKLIVK